MREFQKCGNFRNAEENQSSAQMPKRFSSAASAAAGQRPSKRPAPTKFQRFMRRVTSLSVAEQLISTLTINAQKNYDDGTVFGKARTSPAERFCARLALNCIPRTGWREPLLRHPGLPTKGPRRPSLRGQAAGEDV
jgi:hypothetical protein